MPDQICGAGEQGESNFGGEHPKVAAVRAASRERLAKQESEESRSKETLVKNAATYLETFYQVQEPPCRGTLTPCSAVVNM